MMTIIRTLRSPFMLLCTASAVLLTVLSGCGNSNLCMVKGTVFFDDAPLDKALVSFYPEASSPEAKFASGITDANGVFTLTVRPSTEGDEGKGVPPGNYLITVSRREDKPSRFETMPDGQKAPFWDQMVPAIYTNQKASPLKAVVEKKSENVFEFRLKKG